MIFVTGCARSGTTLITRMLEACGANLGDVGGLAEHMPFKRKVLKPYLKRIGADQTGQNPLPNTSDLPEYPTLKADTDAVIGDAHVIKDVKTALIWPLLHEAYPDAKWLIVYRDPNKIAESCLRTHFMDKYEAKEEWVVWAKNYHARCDDLAQVANAHCVRTADVIEDVEVLRPSVEWMGFEFDADAVKACIDKDRWHGDETS